MTKTRDRDIRSALLSKVISDHVANPDTLVVEELGLIRGSCRVDVAVVNGALHGYEIKSDSDTLARLPEQIRVYGCVLDKATIVLGERHLRHALDLVPSWWGVRIASIGPRGAVNIGLHRVAEANEDVQAEALAHLLWRDELLELLLGVALPQKVLRLPRADLAKAAAESVPLKQLKSTVREYLKRRKDWRSPGRQPRHGGSC